MIKMLAIVMGSGLLAATAPAQEENPQIQLAILLDTSGSMSGLINQARMQLWEIVNEFATAERDGSRPELEVALFEYGKSSLAAEDGYIRMILPLTQDLDAVSQELFALTTNGGDEFCGWVIRDAVDQLEWSDSPEDLKAIFIAGNEPFTQGEVDFRASCQSSISEGIIVNTIHCGSHEDGVSGKWQEGAVLADGQYLNIDQNQVLVHIEAPQDEQIAQLGNQLNQTYIPYGAAGIASAARQEAQDAHARDAAPEVAAQRALFKASSHYRNASWDLVDAVRQGQVELAELDEEALPEEIRALTSEQRRARIEAASQERAAIQEQISQLQEERDRFLAEQMKERGESAENSFGRAMIQAIRTQAQARGFLLP
jgi:hypothetical protein